MPDEDPKMSCWLDHAKSSKLVWSKEVDGQGSDPGKGSLLVSSRATRSCTQPILCQARLAQETCVPFVFFFFFFLSTGSLQVFHGFRLAWYSNPTCSSNDHPSLRQSTERKQVFLWLSCDELTSPYSTVPVKKKTFMQQIRIAQVYLISPPPPLVVLTVIGPFVFFKNTRWDQDEKGFFCKSKSFTGFRTKKNLFFK